MTKKSSLLKALGSAAIAAIIMTTPVASKSNSTYAATKINQEEVSTTNQFENPLDWMAKEASQIPAPSFSYLKNTASYVAYMNTRSQIDLKQAERFLKNIHEKTYVHIIGTYEINDRDIQLIITKDGFIGSFLPKKGTIQGDPRDYVDFENSVKKVAQNLSGKKLGEVSHYSFEQPEAKHITVIDTLAGNKITTDANFKLHQLTVSSHIAFEILNNQLFQPKQTYNLRAEQGIFLINEVASSTGKGIAWDNVIGNVNSVSARHVEILHDGKVSAESSRYNEYSRPLANLFEPTFSDIGPSYWAYNDITWAVKEGITAGYKDGAFKPDTTLTEGDFAVMLTRFYKLNTSSSDANQHRTQPFYDQLSRYNIPLAGYNNNVAKMKPLTRGSLATALAASQGHRGDLRSSVQFLYDNGISAGVTGSKTFEDFHVNDILKRNQISAFFSRMNAKDMQMIR